MLCFLFKNVIAIEILRNYSKSKSDQLKLLKEIQAKLKNIQIIDELVIWGGGGGGDWNCIIDKSLDSMGTNRNLKKDTIKEIEKVKSDFDLLDNMESKCTFQILRGCQGRRTRVGVTTVSSSLILLGWVTKVLKKEDKKWGGGGGRVGENNILTFLSY